MECSIFKKCGSCHYMHKSYEKQLQCKTKTIIHEIKKTNLPICVHSAIGSPKPLEYRNKVIVAFNQRYEYGLYEEKSHRIVPYQKCLLHEEIIDNILMKIQKMLKKYRVSIYDEKRNRGLLRHILIRRAVQTDQTMVVLVCHDSLWKGSKKFCQELVQSFESIKTVVLNVNKRKTSVVLGDEEKILYGKGFIIDELCGIQFKISAKSFYQINHDQCENLYTKATSLLDLKGDEIVVDAYCGIGTIGMTLSKRVKQVIGVELNKNAIFDAKNNARMNKMRNISFVCDDASKFMVQLAKERVKIDIVMMDPPRSGSTREFMDAIQILKPKQIVYISCDPMTQIRDLKYFHSLGYRTHDMYLYDMFPYTEHIESICLLKRK